VVAAQTNAALEEALVSIYPAGGGAIPAGRWSSSWEATRTARTDAHGVYRFDGVGLGHYQMHVQRIGYRSVDLEVNLADDVGPLRVSVGLSLVPIVLEPMTVSATSASPVPSPNRTVWDAAVHARVSAEADRRRDFLAPDARALTEADLTEAVTLGETDVFRALQRLPGVTTRNDYTAELWTRGAPWDQTRVTYDGLPLFSPLHAAGAVSGVAPDVVSVALFHPGVRPAASGEGAAATLELTSRPATERGVHGLAELSPISARVAFEHGASGAGASWILAARRSWVDLATNLLATLEKDSTIPIHYAFTDVAGRLDVPLGATRALEMSGLWSGDALGGRVPHLLSGNQGRWGNALLQATLVAPLGSLTAHHRIGLTRYEVRVDPCADPSCTLGSSTYWNINTRTGISYVTLSSVLGPATGDRWAAGYQFISQRLDYDGWGPVVYPGDAIEVRTPFRGANHVLGLWGETRSHPLTRLTVLTGLRVEAGSKVAGEPLVRIAPRLQARYGASVDGLMLSAGFGRSFQYTQTVGPVGPSIGPELHLTEVWLLAGDTVPAIRSDVATAGAEYWMHGGWVAAFTVYWRGERGVAVPDPTPGTRYPVALGRPFFVSSATVARGAEMSIRRLAGPWTGSVSLTWSRSEITALSYRYPAPTDRRLLLHTTGLFTASQSLRLGGALTVTGGAPFTRYVVASACYAAVSPACPASAETGAPFIEAPSGARAPGYAALDLLADWSRAYRGWTLGAYLQLRNALRATNAATYAGSLDRCVASQPGEVQVRPGLCDRYARGVHFLPLGGVRVSL
jgi:Carboxypeptidase regulatory-like domain